MNIGAAISRVDNMIGSHHMLDQQLFEHRYLAITRGGSNDAVNLTGRLVAEFSAEDVILGNDALERRVDYFHGRGGENIEIEGVSVDAGFEDLVKQLDIPLQPDALADLVQMLLPHLGLKLGVVQKKIGKLRSLLYQVDLRHSLGFALEFVGGDADQLGEHVTGIVESECLIEVTRKNVTLQKLIGHMFLRFA